jgi:hypothetical protein
MDRVPCPLKVVNKPFYAIYRERIKSHDREPTVVSDFLV